MSSPGSVCSTSLFVCVSMLTLHVVTSFRPCVHACSLVRCALSVCTLPIIPTPRLYSSKNLKTLPRSYPCVHNYPKYNISCRWKRKYQREEINMLLHGKEGISQRERWTWTW